MYVYTKTSSNKKRQNSPQKQANEKAWADLLKKYETRGTVPLKTSTAKKPEPFRRTSALDNAPSLDTRVGAGTVVAAKEYTGDAMVGIGQMHKSNAIPIFRDEDAEAIGKMRR